MKKRAKTSLDRISDLPEHLKHCILSLLDIRDAVRTSVLSKRWRHEWNWLPRLTFDRHCIPKDYVELMGHLQLNKKWQRIVSEEKEAYLDFLERTLVRRHTKASNDLEKLSLSVPFFGPALAPRIDLWLACAIGCNVRKLTLDMSPVSMWYPFPESVLAARSVTYLKLINCTITSKYPNTIELLSLHKLSLYVVYVDGKTLKRIIAGCPAIRKLSLCYCLGFKKIEILDIPQLEVVNLYDSTGLKSIIIDALNLQAFSIEGCNSPCQIKVAACKNIRRLILNKVAITDDQLSTHLVLLHLLEDLHLVKCSALKHFTISAQTLKHLIIKHCTRLVKVQIDAPNLESISYRGSDVLSRFFLNARTLVSASVSLSCRTTSADWYVSFIEFLTWFNTSATLTLFVASEKGVLIPEDSRQILIPPLFNVKHMKVEVRYLLDAHSLAEVVDSILWLCPLPDTITISSILAGNAKDIKLHFVYNEPVDSGAASSHSCCGFIPIECWRHSLKEVKIDSLTDAKDGACLMELFEKLKAGAS